MKLLHILKSEPDENTVYFMRDLEDKNDASVVVLNKTETDWEKLIDDIFESDRVFCWW